MLSWLARSSQQSSAASQDLADKRALARYPAWARLPSELLTKVFQLLSFQDLLRAERCCKSWHSVLSNPQVRDLWGTIFVPWSMLESNSDSDSDSDSEDEVASESVRLFPMCKWIQDRRTGISRLRLFFDVDINFMSEEPVWPLHRPPVLQQAFTNHLVSLSLELELFTEHASYEVSLAGVDWSPLTQLTHASFSSIEGTFDVASTVRNLQFFAVREMRARPPMAALARMRALTQLSTLCFADVALRSRNFRMMRHLVGLRSLSITDLEPSSLNTFQGGRIGFGPALDRLTMLTRLFLYDIGSACLRTA
ncbi:hypothetical protein WJX73_004945 [Symbiochloris irregularis]|uniref:F-box domain-containing protein n=1 Tax=Symbiochloris irregularis TaxID=706552 RepID=A0AAW1NUM4_9CHLO